MDLYRTYIVKIYGEDRAKVDDILMRHTSDIDSIRISAQKNDDDHSEVTYWIRPYIYEDYETILNEFKEAGIQTF